MNAYEFVIMHLCSYIRMNMHYLKLVSYLKHRLPGLGY